MVANQGLRLAGNPKSHRLPKRDAAGEGSPKHAGYWGELQTIGFAEVLDSLEPAGNAAVMIVRGKADAVHGASFEGGQLGIDMLQHAVYQAAKTL